jgi:MFS transporter, ACS family, allantoate permease
MRLSTTCWVSCLPRSATFASALTFPPHINAGSAFYISYLVFVIPQSLMMQRFPVGRVLTYNILFFGIFLMLHSACSSFAPLLILRLGLGACEGAVTAGFLIVTSQFYLIEEQTQRVGYWFLMNGTAQIVTALLSYGVQQ